MEEKIKKLREMLKELEEEYSKSKREEYEKQPHKDFKKGDIVCKDSEWGIVGWTGNDSMNINYDDGYMGISLRSGHRGFRAPCKRDEWDKVSEKTESFLRNSHVVQLELTGLDISDILYLIRSSNSTDGATKLKEQLPDVNVN